MKKNTKIIVAFLLLIVGYVSYLIYRRNDGANQFVDMQNDGQGAARSKFWDFGVLTTSATDPNKLIQLGYLPNELPLNSKFAPPVLASDPAFSAKWRASNRKNIEWLVDNFDSIVRKVAESLRLPRALIYMIIAVETGSTAAKAQYDINRYRQLIAQNPYGALGIAQIKPITATETFQIAKNKGFINDYHQDVLVDSVGVNRATIINKRSSPSSKYYVNNKVIGYDGRKEELLNDELNIMLCGLKIANLIDNYGSKNLHHMAYAYNQGDRTVLVYGYKKWTDVQEFVNNVKAGEGRNYVVRCLGQHGALDIIINDLNIIW